MDGERFFGALQHFFMQVLDAACRIWMILWVSSTVENVESGLQQFVADAQDDVFYILKPSCYVDL